MLSTKFATSEGNPAAPKNTSDQKDKIELEWVFGLRADVNTPIHHLDDDRVIYPAGVALVIHSTTTPKQSFVSLNRASHPIAMALSQGRNLLAICCSGTMASVEVWNTETMLCEKVLACQEVASKSYISASFSAGNKMLVAQGGPPDWTMALFLVEKGKLFSVLRLTDTQEVKSVSSISFHPSDPRSVSVIGDQILRLMKLHDKLLKPWGYTDGRDKSYTSQVWFDDHILLVGTSEASILVLEDGELQATLTVSHPDFAKKKRRTDEDKVSEIGPPHLPWHLEVTVIQGFDGGFLCACGPDKIFLFQKSENIHEYFTQRLVMRVCEPSPAARVSERGEHTITYLSLSPNQSDIVVSTHSGQIFKNKLPNLSDFQMQNLVFSPLESLNHEGSIVDVDSCVWKPIACTVGSDKTLRTWELERHKLLFQYTFKEQIYSLALHPTGLHIAVGLTDALHIYHLLFDSVRHFKEMKIRRCSLCKFSWGGQYLVAVDGNLLTLFSSIFLRRSATLKGHTNKITGITWLPDDSSLVSCSVDGGIFGWDLQTNSVAWEIRLNECYFLTSGMIVVEKEGPTILCGSHNLIFHMNIGQTIEESAFSFGSASCIVFCPAKSLIVVGTSEGHLVLMGFPAISASQFTKIEAHASAVTKISVTTDEKRLISCGADGIVIIWNLTAKYTEEEDPALRINKEKISFLPRIPEMLVAQDDVEKMRFLITKLESHVQYLKKDKIHHLALQEKKFQTLLQDLNEANKETELSLNKKINELQMAFQEEKSSIGAEIDSLKQKQLTVRESLMAESREKLMYEYSKQDKLDHKLKEMEKQIETQRKEWEELSKKDLEEHLNQQKATIQSLQHQLQKAVSEMEKERLEDAQLLRLVEASTEVELGHIQFNLNSQLAEEQKRTNELREQRADLQRKVVTMEKEKEATNEKIRAMKDDKTRLLEENSKLEKSLLSLRKEVRHRNEIIAQREEELILNRENVEKKNKIEIIQEHEITRLKSVLKPTQDVIREKTNHIQQLDEELNDIRLQVEARDRQVRHLSQRLTTAQGLNLNLQRRLHTADTRLTRVQSDIAVTSKVIHQPKKLKEAFNVLTEKHIPKGSPGEIWTRTYLSGDTAARAKSMDDSSVDQNTYQELLRQRKILEKALETLKSKEKKDRLSFKSKVSTLAKENRYLLDRVQELESNLSKLEYEKSFSKVEKKPPKNLVKKNEPMKTHQIIIPQNIN